MHLTIETFSPHLYFFNYKSVQLVKYFPEVNSALATIKAEYLLVSNRVFNSNTDCIKLNFSFHTLPPYLPFKRTWFLHVRFKTVIIKSSLHRLKHVYTDYVKLNVASYQNKTMTIC